MNKLIYILLLSTLFLSCNLFKKNGDDSKKLNLSEKNERLYKSLIIKGTTEKILGNYDDAKSIFLECLRINPKSGVAYFELSGIFKYNNNEPQAIEYAKKSLEISPKNEWYKTNLAVLYYESGLYKESEILYRQLSEEHPNRSEYFFTLAETLLYQGKVNEAIMIYNQIEELLGATEELTIHKHKLYLQIGEIEKAIEEINKLIKENPNEVRYYGILAELYEETEQNEKALAMYDKIIQLDPDNGTVRLALYEYYRYHGNKEKSQEQLLLAFKNPNVDIDTKMKIMLNYFTNSENNEALKTEAYELVNILLEAHPESAKSYSVYADFLSRDNRLEEALIQFRKATEYDSSKFAIWSQIVFLESDLKKFDWMKEDSKKGMEIFPSHPSFYFFNGIANIQTGNFDQAIESLNIGKEYVLDNKQLLSEFYQYLGDAYHKKGDHDNSDNSYEKSLALNAFNPYVLNNYSYYLALRKIKLEKAAEMSLRANEQVVDSPSFMDTYGTILFLQGKYTDAELWLKKALLLSNEEKGEILEHYGDVLFMLNNIDQALKYWEKAKEKGGATDLIEQKITEKKYLE